MKNKIRLFLWELESMGEYSCSLPTATTLWKMWKRNLNAFRFGKREPGSGGPHWIVGQYVPCTDPGMIGIRWFDVVLKAGPRPPVYNPPDWDNYDRWRKERDEERNKSRCVN